MFGIVRIRSGIIGSGIRCGSLFGCLAESFRLLGRNPSSEKRECCKEFLLVPLLSVPDSWRERTD